jgi:hypothetical protein
MAACDSIDLLIDGACEDRHQLRAQPAPGQLFQSDPDHLHQRFRAH